MGNGACCAGIPAGTALSSAEVRALLGDRFHQSRFDELAAEEGGDTVTVEQLQHEIAGSIRSHHYPPDFRPSRAPTKGIHPDIHADIHADINADGIGSVDRVRVSLASASSPCLSSRGSGAKDDGPGFAAAQLDERKTGQCGGRKGIYSEHFPPNYQRQQQRPAAATHVETTF